MIKANRSRTSSLVNNLKIFIKVLISHKLVLEVGVNLETDLVISNTHILAASANYKPESIFRQSSDSKLAITIVMKVIKLESFALMAQLVSQ